MTLPVEKFDPFRQVSTRSGLGSWPVCFAGGRWFGLPDFRLCGRACGVAVGFFLEKQLASLRHLFPAKNPTATPRRRALAGSQENFLDLCCDAYRRAFLVYAAFCLRRFFNRVALWVFVGFAGERLISLTSFDWEVLL